MKKSHRARDILFGMLLMAAFVGLLGAAATQKNITVATDVPIYVDGVEMKPTDSNGNPVDTFIYNGTTYVPLRAVSEYLGKAVKWDGNNRRVYIGEVPGQKQYLVDVCPPYQTKDYEQPDIITMAGVKYTKGFKVHERNTGNSGYALYNLNGQYKTLDFDIGHVDGQRMENCTLSIYLDGEIIFSLELDPYMMPTHYSIPLNGALQMQITLGSYGHCYGFVNAELN